MSPDVLCQSNLCPNGNPPSRLECPTCQKSRDHFSAAKSASKLAGQVFVYYTRDFKLVSDDISCAYTLQKLHKRIHDLVTGGAANSNAFNPFPNFNFTGSVRPVYPLSPRRQVPEHILKPDYAEHGSPISEARAAGQPPRILSLDEQERMRKVCKVCEIMNAANIIPRARPRLYWGVQGDEGEVLDIAASHVRPGITTDELDEIVHNATIERGAYPSPLNYRGFPKSFCSSVNEVICHGIPDRRKLQEGDILNIDISLYHDGLHGDLNATYPVGRIDEDSKKLIKTTRQCLDEAIKICKPGALFRDIGKAIEPIARENDCAVVRTYTGHGINDLFHCAPNIPHYAKNKAVGSMKPGMVFTIEPMINLGHNWGDIHWPDNWTATTVDGKRSAQFEDTLLITETGVEILTGPST